MARIMLVDDEYLERMAIRSIIEAERADYEIVAETDNGKEALELALSLKPDVIFMDIRMPIMNGLEAAKLIREELEVAIIFLTAYKEFEYVREGLRMKASDYLLKPIRRNKLLESLDMAIKKESNSISSYDSIWLRELKKCEVIEVHNKLKEALSGVSSQNEAIFRESIEEEMLYITQEMDNEIAVKVRKSIEEMRKILSFSIWVYFLLWLIDQVGLYTYAERKKKSGTDLDLSLQFIELHLRDNIDLSILSKEANFSPTYYSKIFKEHMNVGLIEYIQARRIFYSEILLLYTDLPINQVADDCGFNESNYFSRVFKEYTGLSPTEFKDKNL